jgi:transposase InsO family protein
VGRHYDAQLVARALRDDLQRNGAPLVLRMDRARAHDAPHVRELLAEHGVLVLHGPPHYPCFYGQLERQNREHRAWLGQLPCVSRAALEPCLQQMLESVNTLWRRLTLSWHTAAELWNVRPPLTTDRIAFREEVHDRATHIARSLRSSQPQGLAERLAIERTLERMGYLRQEVGGWC